MTRWNLLYLEAVHTVNGTDIHLIDISCAEAWNMKNKIFNYVGFLSYICTWNPTWLNIIFNEYIVLHGADIIIFSLEVFQMKEDALKSSKCWNHSAYLNVLQDCNWLICLLSKNWRKVLIKTRRGKYVLIENSLKFREEKILQTEKPIMKTAFIRTSMHSGLKCYENDAFNSKTKTSFPCAPEWVSERANEWAQRSARAKRVVRSKRMSERCKRTSKWTSESLKE